MPKLNPRRRPKIDLTEKQIKLIRKAISESKLEGAATLRLYIKKYYNKIIPRNKLHFFLLKEGAFLNQTRRSRNNANIADMKESTAFH